MNGYSAPGATTMTVAYDKCDQPTEVLFHDANRHLIRRVILVRGGTGMLVREEVYLGEQIPFLELQRTLLLAAAKTDALIFGSAGRQI